MSYDLMVFERTKAPTTKKEFMAWYEKQMEWEEEHDYQTISVSSPALQNWFMAMKEKFPLKHEEGLTGPFVIEEIYKATDGQAVITTDVGQHQMWAAQYYRYTSPRTLLTSGGLGTMGFGLGAAMGAKMGRPDKTVINIAGDGCFRMNMNELATLSRHNIPVIEVVVNNHVLGMVRQWQTLFYGKRYSQTVLKDKVDFCKVAEGLGCTAIRVTKKEEVAPAIEKAIALKDRHSKGDLRYYSNYQPDYLYVTLHKDWCEEVIDAPFEDTTLMIPKGWDPVLKEVYGDYMQLPPEEKRVPTHSSLQIQVYD